jgi:hypothetical protein
MNPINADVVEQPILDLLPLCLRSDSETQRKFRDLKENPTWNNLIKLLDNVSVEDYGNTKIIRDIALRSLAREILRTRPYLRDVLQLGEE